MAGIRCENLRKWYGSLLALDGVSFEVQPGNVVALLGVNGSGKTTTVRTLTTAVAPDAGRAYVAGYDVVGEAPQVRRAIGLTAQETVIDRFLTGREYLQLIAQLRHVPRRDRPAEISALLDEFGLGGIASRPVGTYSGGLRRRLDLASTFIAKPPVVFLDEPSVGLDPQSRLSLWAAIKDRAHAGCSVLVTTQHMEEADALADAVVVLARGRVIAAGKPDALKEDLGGRLVELTLDSEASAMKAAAVLDGLGIRCTATGTPACVQFTVLAVEPSLRLALEGLEDARVAVEDFVVRRPSLDEVFLRLTASVDAQYGAVSAC